MKTPATRGALLLIVFAIISALTLVAYSLMDLGLSVVKISKRNDFRTEAQAVAESELEYLFFSFKNTVMRGKNASEVPYMLSDIADIGAIPSTEQQAFLESHRAQGWRVKRSTMVEFGPVYGTIPNTTKTGNYTYITARVEVSAAADSPYAAIQPVRIGRRFENSNSSVFQYSVFFEGDLELNPGSNTEIHGDIYVSGNAFLGPRSGFSLNVFDTLRMPVGSTLNQDADGAVAYYNPEAGISPVTLTSPSFLRQADPTLPGTQLQTMEQPENLLGGVDALATAVDRPDLFGPAGRTVPADWTAAETAIAINNVNRSLIAPPPQNAGTNEYPNKTSSTTDSEVINVRRAYTRAGLIVDISATGTVSIYKQSSSGVQTDVTSDYTGSGGIITATTTLYDAREATNVAITELDVSALKTKLDADTGYSFNGLLYVNQRNSSSASPAAVRVVNAAQVPSSGGAGLSIATNAGMYVKGDYNTVDATWTEGTTTVTGKPACMLMADALTALSPGWDDSNAAAAITSRVANRVDDPGTPTVDEAATFVRMDINAGLLSGNTASNGSTASGGAQNLVRYLENWSGKTVGYFGSLGRLFESTYFDSPFNGTGTVYRQPNRSFTYDTNLAKHPPAGGPTTTNFSRGNMFRW
ncbi:MAG: hypothetical protein NTU80_14255 [Verrucomicrobia bacterium]|nr:hypothetical protein [Verrucomicrobiota bacterium]